MTHGPDAPEQTPFRVGLVPGVTPDKWVRRWRDRRPDAPLELVQVAPVDQTRAVREGRVTMCFVRDAVREPGLHLIPLYEEVPVVVVSHEHPVAAFEEIDVADLSDEIALPTPEMADLSVEQLVETVAAGTGVLVLPMSVARVHHRKDVVAVPVTGVPTSGIGLCWPTDLDDERVEAFIGIVRGRTERSSRGSDDAPDRGARRAPRPAPATSKRRQPASPRGRQRGGQGGRGRRR